jgi:RimJ/RimL family protein N-acetyltransferase
MIRPIEQRDAEQFLELLSALDRETSFLLMEPGERTLTIEAQRKLIETSAPLRMVFVAEREGELVGFVGATRGAFRRNQHSAHLAMGVRRSAQRTGVGSALLSRLVDWAEESGIHRLELTVMAHNLGAIALYLRHGFAIEARRVASLKVDGAYVDEYGMARLLRS